MKKLLPLFAAMFLAAPLLAQKTVRVSTAEELLAAMAPNMTIELEDGIYDLGSLAKRYLATDHAEAQATYDGVEYVFRGLENLTLKGIGQRRAEILNMGTYATVLNFVGGHNLKLQNLEIGHGPMKGACIGAVLSFEQMHDISIDNCLLYGSGTYGITANDVQDLLVENSVIRNCTYGVLTLTDVENATFRQLSCYGNKEFDMFVIQNSRDVLFDRCEIKDNATGFDPDYCYSSLFHVTGRHIELRDCIVRYNTACYLYNKKKAVQLTGNTVFSYNHYLDEVEK